VPSVLWRCWLGGWKGIRPVKNVSGGCWCGCLSEARCRLAYDPADATATHCLLLVKSRFVVPFCYRLTQVIRHRAVKRVVCVNCSVFIAYKTAFLLLLLYCFNVTSTVVALLVCIVSDLLTFCGRLFPMHNSLWNVIWIFWTLIYRVSPLGILCYTKALVFFLCHLILYFFISPQISEPDMWVSYQQLGVWCNFNIPWFDS